MTLPVDQVRAVSLLLKVVAAQDRLIELYQQSETDGVDTADIERALDEMAKARKAAGLDSQPRCRGGA